MSASMLQSLMATPPSDNTSPAASPMQQSAQQPQQTGQIQGPRPGPLPQTDQMGIPPIVPTGAPDSGFQKIPIEFGGGGSA